MRLRAPRSRTTTVTEPSSRCSSTRNGRGVSAWACSIAFWTAAVVARVMSIWTVSSGMTYSTSSPFFWAHFVSTSRWPSNT